MVKATIAVFSLLLSGCATVNYTFDDYLFMCETVLDDDYYTVVKCSKYAPEVKFHEPRERQ